MPSGARIRGGRRGRPARKHLLRGRQLSTSTMTDRDATTTTTALSSLTTELTNGNNTFNKPREERSYKDFFPNLNVKEPLAIVDVQVNSTPTTTDTSQLSTDQADQAVPVVHTPPPLANGTSSLSDTESPSSTTAAAMDQQSPPPKEHHHHLVDHQKEGDIYQALSTRPQAGVNNDVVNLDLLPKPAFQIVDVDDSSHDTDQDVDVDEEETEKTNTGFQRPENHYIRYIGRTKIGDKEREREKERKEKEIVWCACVWYRMLFDWLTHCTLIRTYRS